MKTELVEYDVIGRDGKTERLTSQEVKDRVYAGAAKKR
jgi:hypothetical protein